MEQIVAVELLGCVANPDPELGGALAAFGWLAKTGFPNVATDTMQMSW